jgi:protein tyrosine/serine phosphatase
MVLRTRLLRTAFALALVLASAAQIAAAAPSIRIENFGTMNANYYRGAQPKGRDYGDLAALGVKTIIDLQDVDGDRNESVMAKAAGLAYYRIPMSTHRAPTDEQLARFFKLVNDPAAQPVYVHCKGGRHRTGVMTAAYRMAVDGWTPDQAFDEMKRFDFGPAFLHAEFKDYVYTFDAKRVPAAVIAAQQ